MSAPAFLWPVWRFNDGRKQVVAVFWDWGASVDFIARPEDFGAHPYNYFQGRPQYDERKNAERYDAINQRALLRTIEIKNRRAA